jgi:hypothetical protein
MISSYIPLYRPPTHTGVAHCRSQKILALLVRCLSLINSFSLLLTSPQARSLASDQSNPLKAVNDFVSQNSGLFKSKSGDDGDTLKYIEDSVNGFQDTAKTVVKGLNALGQVHPFVGSTFEQIQVHSRNHFFIFQLLWLHLPLW